MLQQRSLLRNGSYTSYVPCNVTCSAGKRPILQLSGHKAYPCKLKLRAFRDNEYPYTSGAPTDPAASSAPDVPPLPTTKVQDLLVYTTDGVKHTLPITPGITTVAHIRAEVAEKTNTAPGEVRLAYAGQELQPALDFQAFVMKPGIDVMHAMGRLRGGGAPAPDSNMEAIADDLLADDATFAAATAAAAALLDAEDALDASANPGRHSSSSSSSGGGSGGSSNTSTGSSSSIDMQSAQGALHSDGQDHSFSGTGTVTAVERNSPVHNYAAMYSSQLRQNMQRPRKQRMGLAAAAQVPDSRRRVDVHRVPGGRPGGSAQVQLARQFRDLMKNPIPGISAAPDDDDITVWNVRLAGPEGSPYAGGWFNVKLTFPASFPGDQPHARFITPIWHPNVSEVSGNVCAQIGRRWHDVCTVGCVLSALQMLLSTPNADSPLNREAAIQMKHDMAEFERQARGMTRQHAM